MSLACSKLFTCVLLPSSHDRNVSIFHFVLLKKNVKKNIKTRLWSMNECFHTKWKWIATQGNKHALQKLLKMIYVSFYVQPHEDNATCVHTVPGQVSN